MNIKQILIFFFAFVLVFCNNNCEAQISRGGKPLGLNNTLNRGSKISVIKMPAFDIEKEKINNANKKCEVFAKKIEMKIDVKKVGQKQVVDTGNVWHLEIKSDGAYSLNLIFSKYKLAKRSRLFIYSADEKHVIGAFTEDNNSEDGILATEMVKGDDVVIELFEPLKPEFESELVLESVNHDYTNIEFQDGNFGVAASCCVDVNCAAGADWQIEKQSVCLMIIDGIATCSGALVNNIKNDGTPYFLTADHCYTRLLKTSIHNYAGLVSRTVFYFDYESPACGGTDGNITRTHSKASLVANWSGSDFCLLKLGWGIPPTYNPYYAGWYVGNTATGTPSIMIHHPAGAVKKINVKNSAPITSPSFPKFWRINQWDIGETQEGSSGAPLFNSQHQIIGQHQGIVHYGTKPPDCSQGKMYEMGKLYYSWSGGGTDATRLSNWLANSTPKNYMHGLRYVYNYYSSQTIIDSNTAVSGDFVRFENVKIKVGSTINVKFKNGFEAVGGFNAPLGTTLSITK